MNLKKEIIQILFPTKCVLCKKEGSLICNPCIQKLPDQKTQCFVCKNESLFGKTCQSCQHKTAIDYFISCTKYHSPIKKILHAYKYKYLEDLQYPLTKIILKKIKQLPIAKNSSITTIPLHRIDENKRGFNQSELIARNIASIKNTPFKNTLKKKKHTKKQASLKKTKRMHNLSNTFVFPMHMHIKNESCIIIDDVKTTGSTIETAARILKENGAKKIIAITIAS